MRSTAMMRCLLFMMLLLRQTRDSELPFERGEFVDVDRADEVDERQLLRLGADDDEAVHGLPVAARVDVDLGVVAIAASHGDDALPVRAELIAHAGDDAAVVLALAVE